jgi:hypothetical protein
VFVFALLVPAAFADTKEDPHVLLSKSFQQADLWNQGPVKLVAKVRTDTATGQARNLEYTVSWAGPEKWRVEWSAPDLQQITILNNGKLSYATNDPKLLYGELSYVTDNDPKLLWFAIQFQAALAALDGGTAAGPYSLAPLAYGDAKVHVSKKTINGPEARCLTFGKPKTTLCIDPASGHLLTAQGDLVSFAYSDYTTIGSNSYPQTVKLSSVHTSYEGDNYGWVRGVSYPQDLKEVQVKTPIEQAQVTVTRGEQFPDSLFAAPEKSTTMDFATCTDPASNFTAPRLDKSVKAKRPDAASKGYRYGWVWVLATVSKDGSVQKITALSGDPALSTGATNAVRRYKYTPYMRCGQAVEFQQVVVVPFPPPPPPVYTEHSPERASYPTCFPCAPH